MRTLLCIFLGKVQETSNARLRSKKSANWRSQHQDTMRSFVESDINQPLAMSAQLKSYLGDLGKEFINNLIKNLKDADQGIGNVVRRCASDGISAPVLQILLETETLTEKGDSLMNMCLSGLIDEIRA